MSEYIVITLIPREISREDCRPWNPISPHRNVHSQEWKERKKKKNRFFKDVMAKISGRERKVGACRELYFPGSDKNNVLRCMPPHNVTLETNKSIRSSYTSYDNYSRSDHICELFSFRGIVTSEGIHKDLYVEGIHLTFPPDTVAEPTRIMVYRWNYEARLRLPHLMESEVIVSNVIEISAATEVGALEFNGEVKLVLPHFAADLEGYERVMKRLVDTETNVWEEIPSCEDIRKVSGNYFYPIE